MKKIITLLLVLTGMVGTAKADVITVYFTNSLNWDGVNIYYWNDGPEWPGTAMTYVEDNDFGEKIYSATIPADVTGILFNDGTNQTVEITTGIADGTAWYADGQTDGSGHYYVGTWTYKLANGFYLIGVSGWTVSDITTDDLFTDSNSDGVYELTTTLDENNTIKVVKVENGAITTWYPDGTDNEYTVDANHAGEKTISFQESYNEDWSEFGGYMYIEDNGTKSGFYLIGVNGWTVDDVTAADKFTDTDGDGVYELITTLAENNTIKVVKVENGSITTWYPDGFAYEYVIDADHAGNVKISFQETYNENWAEEFGGYFYIAAWNASGPSRAVTAGNFGTICLPYNATLTGATAYTITGKVMDGETLTGINLESVETLEAGKPYIFKATANEITTTYTSTTSKSATAANGMMGNLSSTAVTVPQGNYVVGSDNLLHKVTGDAVTCGQYKAYITLDGIDVATARGANFIGFDEEATGISNVETKREVSDVIYNLQGQRVVNAQKGLFIVNGKKLLRK